MYGRGRKFMRWGHCLVDDLSIIVPVGRGDKSFEDMVAGLLKLKFDFEILIIGPEFIDTPSNDSRLKFIYSPEGRALQQNNAVMQSKKNNIWFLHADSRISEDSLSTINSSLKKNPHALFFFDLKFLNDGVNLMKLNDLGVTFRSRIFKMPFGDQGLFMSKKTFFKLGFFDEKAAYGEDHLLVWKAHQMQIEVLPCKMSINTSARKYKTHGWLKTTLKHVFLTYKQAFPEWVKSTRLKNTRRPSTAVAIFVKTPGYSQVKSRLAATIGVPLAEEFFRLSLEATKSAVIQSIRSSSGNLEAYWAVAEKECLNHPLWNDFETVTQGEGGLGDRLDLVYKNLLKKHDSVLLIGADLPHLDFKKLTEAQRLLSTNSQFVMGKTDDGGFYLFGGRTKIEKDLWTSVTYSSETTADELISKLGKKRFVFLEKNFDIDHEVDLKRLSTYTNPNLLPAQEFIVDWSKNTVFKGNT